MFISTRRLFVTYSFARALPNLRTATWFERRADTKEQLRAKLEEAACFSGSAMPMLCRLGRPLLVRWPAVMLIDVSVYMVVSFLVLRRCSTRVSPKKTPTANCAMSRHAPKDEELASPSQNDMGEALCFGGHPWDCIPCCCSRAIHFPRCMRISSAANDIVSRQLLPLQKNTDGTLRWAARSS